VSEEVAPTQPGEHPDAGFEPRTSPWSAATVPRGEGAIGVVGKGAKRRSVAPPTLAASTIAPYLSFPPPWGLHRLAGELGGTACRRSGGSGPRSVLGDEDLVAVLGGTSCPCIGRREQARGRVV